MMELNTSSKAKLKGVHPDLVRVVNRCAKDWADKQFTFGLTCGVRTLEEQKVLVKKGASKTLKSRHIPAPNGYSHAVDVVAFIDGKIRWDWPLYDKIAKAMKAAAKSEKVPIEWGGDWVSFKDGPHFQLPWDSYPGKK
jgi:peptidoglycan L-alanyl-D-glutamate endopeptidase CwlK